MNENEHLSFNPDTFCIGPFSEVRINPDGSMDFCHAADTSMIPTTDNIQNLTVDQYFSGTGSSAHQARQSFKQGESLARCHRCYKNEALGLISFRQRRNLQAAIFQHADFIPSSQEAWPRISSWRKPRFYHVSLGNLCNLACMMCHPRWSSLLTTVQKKAGLLPGSTAVLRDWTQDSQTWENFVQHLLNNPEIVCLHFMGGEPMFHKKFAELLDVLVSHNHRDFEVSVVTNGSIYSQAIVDRLLQFRTATIEISIESLDRSNDYIRYPGNYLDTQTNIESYLSLRSDRFSVVLRSVPQLLSAIHYDRLLHFALHNNVMIDSNVLHDPDYLRLNMLPDQIRHSVIDRLSQFVKHDDRGVHDFNLRNTYDLDRAISLHAQSVIDQINQPCHDVAGKIQNLISYCTSMDRARNIRVEDYIPDLADFFERNGYGNTHQN